jgi:indoleamine 2,3-dioxygenase
LKKTSHPTATGGSPIVTWLPNQLQAVMQAMVDVWEGSGKSLGKTCEEVMDLLYVQRETLRKEVEKYCQERNVDANKV